MANPTHQVELEVTYRLKQGNEKRRFSAGKIAMGRDRSCELVLPDASVSRRHAQLELVDGHWVLTDTGSANGVMVRGKSIRRHVIIDGDTIELGNLVIECRISVPDAAPVLSGARESTSGMSIQSCDIEALLDGLYDDGESREPREQGAPESRVMRPRPVASAQRPAWSLRLLRDASDALMSHDDLKSTLEVVMDLVFEHLPADRGQILLRVGRTEKLRAAVRRYRVEAEHEGLKISRHIALETLRTRRAVLVKDTMEDGYEMVDSIVSNDIRSAMCAPLCHRDHVLGLIWLDRTSDCAMEETVFQTTDLEVLSILASMSAAAVDRAQLRDNIEEERRVRDRLSRYHAPAVVEQIVRSERLGQEMDTAEREITVLFCDITRFTSLSESLAPKQVIEILNCVFQTLTEQVFEEGGTLDKFIGDAMMVFFGAPIAQPDHAIRAVRTALGMQRRMAELNASGALGKTLGIRIGINTGPAIVGDVGANDRKDYTVIGDTVNVASRLESSVARSGEVVIGPRTFAYVKDHFTCEELGEMNLKGKQLKVHAFRVVDP